MPKAVDDLGKISELMLDFFDTPRIRESLEKIHKYGISGWEKWWQTELAIYLAQADDTVAEWDMEHPFDTDGRSKLSQSRMALDIGFRLVRHAKDEWYFIELLTSQKYRRQEMNYRDRAESDSNEARRTNPGAQHP